MSRLTLNRRKVITEVAYEPTNEPQGQRFAKRVGISPAAIKKALTSLVKLDMIFQDQAGYYQILDPAMTYFITKRAFKRL